MSLHPEGAAVALAVALRRVSAERSLEALDAYVREASEGRVRHFKPSEYAPAGKRHASGVVLQVPPVELWQNIVGTLMVCEDVRDHFGRPVLITSGYRDPAYNAAVGGAPNSLHRHFNACDIVVPGVPAADVYAFLDPLNPGGLGSYADFTHVDCRHLLDMPRARW